MSTAHEVPQRLFNLLSDHESCVDKVNKQLDSKTDSKMVHRFQGTSDAYACTIHTF